MKHPDWPAFLATIIAEPDEDTPRLVAADFLEENGEGERAAFIRIQIALARLESSQLGQSLEARQLRRKELEYLGPLTMAPRFWAAEDCPELTRRTVTQTGSLSLRVGGGEQLVWRRGFVEWVRCGAVEWLRHGVAVRKRNPVRGVILSGCDQVAREVWAASLDSLRGLRRVNLKFGGSRPDFSAERGLELAAWLREQLPGTPFDADPLG